MPQARSQCAFSFPEVSSISIWNSVFARQFRILEPQIGAARLRARVQRSRIEGWLESRDRHFLRRSNLQQGVQSSARVVRHQDFHLSFGQVFDGLVLRPRLTILTLSGTSGFLVIAPPEEPSLLLDAAPCHDLFGRSLDEIFGRLFVPGPERDRGIRRRGNLLLKAAADLHELWEALHREQECGVRAAGGLQDLGEIAISEWRELVQHYREDRAILPPP